jgi:hypothetical protein
MTETQATAMLEKLDALLVHQEQLIELSRALHYGVWVAVYLLSMLAAWRMTFWARSLLYYLFPLGR